MAVNLPKIADTPYLSLYCNSTKQNDNVTMTFPVNSSLQCFRTAALSMVTLNMESRNPMGRVNAENHSKTWKSSGVNGLTRNDEKSDFLPWKWGVDLYTSSTYTRVNTVIFTSFFIAINFSWSFRWPVHEAWTYLLSVSNVLGNG